MTLTLSNWLLSLRWRYNWAMHEMFVMRPAYAHDRGQMEVAYGQEADDHYGYGQASRLLEIRRFVEGFLEGLFMPELPSWWTDGWFVPISSNIER